MDSKEETNNEQPVPEMLDKPQFKELQAEDAMLAGDQKTQLPPVSENEESELPPPPSARVCHIERTAVLCNAPH